MPFLEIAMLRIVSEIYPNTIGLPPWSYPGPQLAVLPPDLPCTPPHARTVILAAVVLADATTILLAAPAMSFKLTMGMSPF